MVADGVGRLCGGTEPHAPHGGAGRSFAGLTVDQFQRRTSVVEYRRDALSRSLAAVQTLAALEGLDAHGRSAAIRLTRGRRR
ncbi:MAG: histidinol dehydrogenase [Verrucomicrobia bacterium]|nr:histidinol dehydrogenase [Verrucomicrobiota bacterium]